MKLKKLVLFAVAVTVAVAFTAVGTLPAAAQDSVHSLTFAFTGYTACLVSLSPFNANGTASGATQIVLFASTGTFTFNAVNGETLTGTGTASFTNVGFGDPGGQFSGSVLETFTYTVGNDGALTVTPTSLTAGTTTKTGVAPFTGQISPNGTIVLTSSKASVETTYNSSGGIVNYAACHRTRTLVPVPR